MVKKITLFLAVMALLLPQAVLATTVTGKVADAAGNAVSGASVTFRLINIGRGNVARVSGTSVVAPKAVTATSASDGTFSATLTGNDQITPSGTLYEVLIRGAGFAYGPFDYSITGSAADLDSLTPVATFANTPSQVSIDQVTPPPGCSGQLAWENNAWSCQSASSIPDPLSTVALYDKGGERFDVLSYGLSTANTAAENTAALNTLLATVVANHGGTIYFPPSGSPYVLDPDITIPNDGLPGGISFANQYPIKIEGAVSRQSQASGSETDTYDQTSGSALKFEGTATNADIVTLGQGNLTIENMTLETTNCSPFILTTQTTLRIYGNLFIGSAETPSACNDAIILGGTDTSSAAYGTVTQNFGGFGTVIRGNTFKKIRRIVLAQTYADDWFLEKNTYASTSGNNAYCVVDVNDPNSLGSLGGYVLNNRFEMDGALCAMKAVNATTPVFAFNDLEDFPGTPLAGASVVDLINSEGAQVYAGFDGPPTGVPYVNAEDSTSETYNFVSNSSSIPSQIYSLQPTILQMQNANGLNSYDASGNEISSGWQSTGNYYFKYTPSGGSTSNVYGVSVGDPTIRSFYLEGSSQNFFRGEGSLYNYFLADSGWALLGNAADHFALGVDPADGSLKVDKWQRLVPHTFSTYPACSSSTEGDQAAINDSTTNTLGATITGGGSDHVLGYCDGTNWTVTAE